MGEGRGAYRALVGTPERKRPFGRPRVERRITSKWIFQKRGGKA